MRNNSIRAIDNIFIDKVKYENYSLLPLVNRLSDHDAQSITINNITVDKCINKTQSIRKCNTFTVNVFAINLRYENCDNIFIKEYVNTIFNNFFNT